MDQATSCSLSTRKQVEVGATSGNRKHAETRPPPPASGPTPLVCCLGRGEGTVLKVILSSCQEK